MVNDNQQEVNASQTGSSSSSWLKEAAASRQIGVSNRSGNAGATPAFTYEASQLSSQYSMQGLSYPEDLMSNPAKYGYNRVVFYINVSTDSRVLRSSGTRVVEGVTRDMRSQLLGEKITGAQAGFARRKQSTNFYSSSKKIKVCDCAIYSKSTQHSLFCTMGRIGHRDVLSCCTRRRRNWTCIRR